MITDSANWALSVHAIDMDGDLDIDVLSGSFSDQTIRWFENDGNQNFIPHNVNSQAQFLGGPGSVLGVDIDRDGDTDVLSSASHNFELPYFENDGSQNFTPHKFASIAFGAAFVSAADIDSDSDTDILVAFEDDIRWYENDGSQVFAQQHIITSNALDASSVFSIDLDGDGDMDVLSSSITDDKIAWYENMEPVGIQEKAPLAVVNEFRLLNNFPNPFNPMTTIEFDLSQSSDVTLKIYNILGEEVATLLSASLHSGSHSITWDASHMASGLYIYRLEAGDYVEMKKMILMK